MYIKNIHKAMQRVVPGETMEELHISKRYQGELRKQFRINGVPWIYDLKERGPNPRDRPPKSSKALAEKLERLKKIQKNMLENEKKKTQFRQDKLDARPLGGIDKLIAKTLPSHIKGDS